MTIYCLINIILGPWLERTEVDKSSVSLFSSKPRVCSLSSKSAGHEESVIEKLYYLLSPFQNPRIYELIRLLVAYLVNTRSRWTSRCLTSDVSTARVMPTVIHYTLFIYTWPHPNSQIDKFLALFDAVLTPFLNPVIYTFRNKEMKVAIKRVLKVLLTFRNIS